MSDQIFSLTRTAGLGLLVGLPLGVVIERADFCMHTAFRQALRGEGSASFRAYLLALGLQMVLIHLLAAGGFLELPFAELTRLAARLGGAIFGWGMVWAKG